MLLEFGTHCRLGDALFELPLEILELEVAAVKSIGHHPS